MAMKDGYIFTQVICLGEPTTDRSSHRRMETILLQSASVWRESIVLFWHIGIATQGHNSSKLSALILIRLASHS